MSKTPKNWDFPRESLTTLIEELRNKNPGALNVAIGALRRMPDAFRQKNAALEAARKPASGERKLCNEYRDSTLIAFDQDIRDGKFTSDAYIAQLLCLSETDLGNCSGFGLRAVEIFRGIFESNGFAIGEFSDDKVQLGVTEKSPSDFVFLSIEGDELDAILSLIEQQESHNTLTHGFADNETASVYNPNEAHLL